MEIYTLLLVKA